MRYPPDIEMNSSFRMVVIFGNAKDLYFSSCPNANANANGSGSDSSISPSESLRQKYHFLEMYLTELYLPLDFSASYLNAPYSMSDDMVAEIKAQLAEYLPENFDFARNLCSISGTYFG